MITRSDILKHLEYGIRTGFLHGVREYTPLRNAFSRDLPSDGAFEDYADMGDIPWPVQNSGKIGNAGTTGEAGTPKVGELTSGTGITIMGTEERSLRVYNADWEISIGITHNSINDDRAGDLEDWARDAGANFQKHMDYIAFSLLNSGDGTTYGTCYDGSDFFDNDHSDPGAEYTTNQDNEWTLSLTMDNYETVRVAASKFLDSRGQPAGVTHNLLVVPPELEREAFQIVGNPNVWGTANRDLNPYQGRTTLLVAPGSWLDSTSWMLVDNSQARQRPVYLQVRQAPQLVQWDEEKGGDGGTRYFKWHARYNGFYGDWRLAAQGQT